MSKKQLPDKPKTVTIPTDPNALMKLKISLGIIIAAFAFLLYAQSIFFNYTLDDETVITGNTITKQGLAALPEILTTDYWHGYIHDIRVPEYRPFSMLLFATEWQLFPNNPMLYHIINVALYSLTCWLLFMLLCKLFEKQNLIFPFVCSLLYLAHPLHTEVVDSIKSLDEISCFLFGLLSIWFIFRYEEKRSKYDIILGSVCYFISLMSKESGITFLIIIPLLLFVFSTTDFKKIARTALILASISCVFFLIRYKVLESLSSSVFEFQLAKSEFNAPDILTQKATSCYILLKYIFLLIFPYPLSYDYSFAQIPFHKFTDILTITGIVIYVALGIYALIFIRKKSVVSFAILFYLITLFPVSNIFLLIAVPMAERFMYIPSLGFCMVLTYLLIKATKTETAHNNFSSFGKMISGNSSLFTIVFIILGLYSIITLARNPDWENNITLHGNDVTESDNSARTHFNWGGTLLNVLLPKEQNGAVQEKLLDSAIAEFTKTIRINKVYPEAYASLGICFFDKADYPNAIKYYEIAKSQFPKPDINVFNNLAYCYGAIGQMDKALSNADSAIKVNKDFEMAHVNRGFILYKMGRLNDAIIENKELIRLNSENINAYKNIGNLYISLGDTLKAKQYFEEANRKSKEQQR